MLSSQAGMVSVGGLAGDPAKDSEGIPQFPFRAETSLELFPWPFERHMRPGTGLRHRYICFYTFRGEGDERK